METTDRTSSAAPPICAPPPGGCGRGVENRDLVPYAIHLASAQAGGVRMPPRHLTSVLVLAAVLAGAAGCGHGSSTPSSVPPNSTPYPTGPSGSSTTSEPTSGTGTTTTSTATPVMVLPLADATTNGAFLSPTRNLACLIAKSPASMVRCASFTPPLLVTMTPDGSFTPCQGNSCELGNPAEDTKVLPYGAATGDGTFTCSSSTAGFTCTITTGKGFAISRAGIVPVGS